MPLKLPNLNLNFALTQVYLNPALNMAAIALARWILEQIRGAGYKDLSFGDEIRAIIILIGREPTMWPPNNCLRITVFGKCLAANNILLMRKWNHAFLPLAIALGWKWQIASQSRPRGAERVRSVSTGAENDRFASRRYSLNDKLGDQMIKQSLNLVVAKYRDLSVSRRSIICLGLRFRQIIDLLAIDKSRYFAQPRRIIVIIIIDPWLLSRLRVTDGELNGLNGTVKSLNFFPSWEEK